MKCNSIIFYCVVFCLFSSAMLITNALFYQFPGNNYFPPETLITLATIILIYLGCYLQFGKKSAYTLGSQELGYFFIVMCILAYASNAIQFTPFPLIDDSLIRADSFFHINITDFFPRKNYFKQILTLAYGSLSLQMCLLPLMMIIRKATPALREYYFLIIVSSFIGFTFYYFFPSTAPASHLSSPFFSAEQHATGLKYMQIHHYITPTTLDGGMIACPSFHIIWGWCCLYLVRHWKCVFVVILGTYVLLGLSCVLLGWHYFTDLIGSVIVLCVTHFLKKQSHSPSLSSPLLAPLLPK